MHEVVVVGTGPSAAMAVKTLIGLGKKPLVLDATVSSSTAEDDALLPQNVGNSGLPPSFTELKLWMGEADAYRRHRASQIDFGSELRVRLSHAFGGLSRVWGATVDFPSEAELERLGIVNETVLSEVKSFLGGIEVFSDTDTGTSGSQRLRRTGESTEAAFRTVSGLLTCAGWHVRSSRLAIREPGLENGCTECGHCISGCPVDAIWYAGTYFRALENAEKIILHRDVLVTRIIESDDEVKLECLHQGNKIGITCSKVFLACGPLSTAALALGLDRSQGDIVVKDTATEITAAISLRPGRLERGINLSQWWATDSKKVIAAQFYPPSEEHLPKLARYAFVRRLPLRLKLQLLRHVFPVIVYRREASSDWILVRRNADGVDVQAFRRDVQDMEYGLRRRQLRNALLRGFMFLLPAWVGSTPPGSGFHHGALLDRETLKPIVGASGHVLRCRRTLAVDASALRDLPLGSITPTVMYRAAEIVLNEFNQPQSVK